MAFPDNWSVGLSFYHNLFVREHNTIVDEFRAVARETPDADSGLRNPERPSQAITYGQITDDELFEIARLIVCRRDREDPHHRMDAAACSTTSRSTSA